MTKLLTSPKKVSVTSHALNNAPKNITSNKVDSHSILNTPTFEYASDSSVKNVRAEHVINIKRDDENVATSSVVLDNLSGSARTDYKFNRIYIEKYALKRKLNMQNATNKKLKGLLIFLIFTVYVLEF
jgi:hypothetical protein